MGLDIFSHWLQMYSTLLTGAASHKALADEVGLVRAYYRLPGALFAACLAHEGARIFFDKGEADGQRVQPVSRVAVHQRQR